MEWFVKRTSWTAYVYHPSACTYLLMVGPAQALRAREGRCHALLILATQPFERCERLASGVPIRERIPDSKLNIDRSEGVGQGGEE